MVLLWRMPPNQVNRWSHLRERGRVEGRWLSIWHERLCSCVFGSSSLSATAGVAFVCSCVPKRPDQVPSIKTIHSQGEKKLLLTDKSRPRLGVMAPTWVSLGSIVGQRGRPPRRAASALRQPLIHQPAAPRHWLTVNSTEALGKGWRWNYNNKKNVSMLKTLHSSVTSLLMSPVARLHVAGIRKINKNSHSSLFSFFLLTLHVVNVAHFSRPITFDTSWSLLPLTNHHSTYLWTIEVNACFCY